MVGDNIGAAVWPRDLLTSRLVNNLSTDETYWFIELHMHSLQADHGFVRERVCLLLDTSASIRLRKLRIMFLRNVMNVH
jgi:hypothetical protein